ncbi:ABC transporter substrate-binding protein [Microbacterium sp.]|uniref:substrate-binding periplasmic protein n=1 Tax=Microbacterium sp. TaxID=51671 RepID=UPI000926BB59|nr:ABC transporter substrate-binding protein [Microbacterium sp.]MBN9189703.1 amino acid ABC transporter substrate-binding protein [Microbacterium sp.]MBN9193915.1 amino acid ABC transporter substrate-binding protein [Microbacterium sp.]OJU70132.1 MAG: hypothetical protein BGO04_05465 [Microbacterium sp. 70-38]
MRKASIAVFIAAASLALAGCASSGGGSASVPAGCTPAHKFDTVESGKLTVATPVSPPYSIKDGSSYKGLDIEILQKIAKMECLSLSTQEMSFAAGLQSVQSGRVDTAAGGVGKTEERAKVMGLSTTTYRDGMALMSKEGYKTIDQLKTLTIGVVQGYFWNDDLIKVLGNDRVKQYQGSDAMFADLDAGRINVAVSSTAEAGYRKTQFPKSGLKIELLEPTDSVAGSQGFGEVAIPTKKGASAIESAVNADVQSLLNDGTIAGILKSYNIDPALAGPVAK